MAEVFVHILDLLSRYLHIACTTVLVGGTLFYEMIVPAAIDELKTEQQLDVFGRARWFFRRLVWISAIVLLVSGIISARRHWREYSQPETADGIIVNAADVADAPEIFRRPGWWWAAHTSAGALAVLIALYLTSIARPPDHPIGWMRLNLVILLVVIFLGSAARHVRLVNNDASRGVIRVPFVNH